METSLQGRPTKLYVNQRPTLYRYDVLSKQLEKVFDVTAEFGSDRYIWQVHSSNDDKVHSATVRSSSTYAMLGCVVYEESLGRFSCYEAKGDFDECQVDKSGHWLLINLVDEHDEAVRSFQIAGPTFSASALVDGGVSTVLAPLAQPPVHGHLTIRHPIETLRDRCALGGPAHGKDDEQLGHGFTSPKAPSRYAGHRLSKPLERHRLLEEHVHGLTPVPAIGRRRGDDADRQGGPLAPDRPHDLPAAQFRHHEIRQHEVHDLTRLEAGQPLSAIRGREDRVAIERQHESDDIQDRGLVVDQENSQSHWPRFGRDVSWTACASRELPFVAAIIEPG